MTSKPTMTKWKRGAAASAGFALVATLVATSTGPASLSASSHREAPLIAGDPRADNTDTYAFVSPDDEDTVTLVANWIPFEEPNGGPNFYPWADGDGATSGASYKINVDNDGDAKADLVYEWLFTTITKDPGQFLVNTGPFSSVNDPTLNVYQTYDLIVTDTGVDPDDASDDVVTTVLDDAISAPSISGAVSTPDYQALVDEAVTSGTAGELKSFAGQADDSFFLDLRVFDLLYGANAVPEVGEDTLAGYNVNTIALQVPKSELALAGDDAANPVIGVWSTTDRIVQTEGGSTPMDDSDDQYERVQVSRLGNPLVNEVVLPLALKDAFNSIPPTADATIPEAVAAVRFPILPPLVELIYGQPVPGDVNGTPLDTSDDEPRSDLVEIFLQGVSQANFGLGLAGEGPTTNPALNADLNDLALNAGVASATPSEMLRLNMAVPVSADPSPLGVLGGDFQGFPNGRRLADDVVDIALAVAEGAVFKSGADVSALAPFDSVDRNDRDFLDTFPYVALPHVDSVVNGTERTPRVPEITSVNPDRILDTRPASAINYTGDKPAAGTTLTVKVAGVGEALVPDDAQAVYLNVTAARTEERGFITVFPCDQDQPEASSFNPDPVRTTSGLIPAVMDADGNVCIFTNSATDLIVDVSGYVPSTSDFTSVVPERVLDTRSGDKPAAGSETVIQVTETGDANLPAGTSSVLLGLTSLRTDVSGFVTVYSCDEDAPTASNLNTREGERRANLVSTAVSADGTVCVFSNQPTDLVVDLVGATPASSTYQPTLPTRLLDTRPDSRVNYTGAKPIEGQILEVQVRGAGTAVPADAGTVVLNVTGLQADTNGFITVFPCGEDRPETSNINLSGLTTAAMVVAKVGDNDRVCVYTDPSAHVLVDIIGHFPGTIIAS
ncbi:MAG: DUF4331 domain-containing protein [Ilumatobacter sp.]